MRYNGLSNGTERDRTETPNVSIHPMLLRITRTLRRENAELVSGVDWVGFLSDNAYIEAEVKPGGGNIVSIHAYLLGADGSDVEGWVAAQPSPVLGVLQAQQRGSADGAKETLAVLRFDVLAEPLVEDFIDALIVPFAEAWETRSVTEIAESDELHAAAQSYRPTDITGVPRNAWLLMGDEASYPTKEEVVNLWKEAAGGINDWTWTAPKNGELGDLALIYFIAPRKTACFVARLASQPFPDDVEVNAVAPVNRHQWWSYLTPPIEIKPIPYKTLQQAHNDFLPLKGRSGHYLPLDTIRSLSFVAVDTDQQRELDRLVLMPAGYRASSGNTGTAFETWKEIPAGLLPLEAKVSELVVWPLVDLILQVPTTTRVPVLEPTLGPMLIPEYRVPGGYVDFIFEYGEPRIPVLAIEVKLTIVRPRSGVWQNSPDFRQLRRYMDALDVPGLLIDAQSILFVRPGASAPSEEIKRADATWSDIGRIRDLLLEAGTAARETKARPAALETRRILKRG